MKIAVLYNTRSGNTKRMAERIVEGMTQVAGAEPALFDIADADAGFIKESRCVVLGTPTYLATMTAAVKSWLDQAPGKFPLAGKIGGAFATADYIHGGGEIAVQSILSHFMVLGMLAYSGGGAHGKPVIHMGPVAIRENIESFDETFRLYGQRLASKTTELFGGGSAG